MTTKVLSLLAATLLACSNGSPATTSSPVGAGSGAPSTSSSGIDTVRAKELLSAGAPVVDVRTAEEFDAGHLERALNIPVDDVGARLSEFEALVSGDKTKPLVLYCGSGKRAATAKKTLEQAGFTQVVNGGGYSAMKP